MTRIEQMYREIDELKYHADSPFDYETGFKHGVKWADEHPNLCKEEQVGMNELGMMWQKQALIEKACKWLEEKNKMCMYELEMILGKNFIKDFKKAMKK